MERGIMGEVLRPSPLSSHWEGFNSVSLCSRFRQRHEIQRDWLYHALAMEVEGKEVVSPN